MQNFSDTKPGHQRRAIAAAEWHDKLSDAIARGDETAADLARKNIQKLLHAGSPIEQPLPAEAGDGAAAAVKAGQ